ncbi:ABC transporter ATP-binding protein/permease [Labrys wisconsinensis]|uniref:ATP-binding cassette transporter n=1 Tax=Labrys wisconsinensis TaxID=425677 RepID=A0ABU0JGG8_9HYPH|nr:ABC transporter ATP-binding protein/permease [Labrys wisconsinensis]MDQ0473395.1 putative ATP-binding cassette transporter [Labrys wisconsinensis]
MTGSGEIASAASEIEEAAHAGLVPQLRMMFEALWASPVRNRLFALAAGLFLVIGATAYGQIQLNSWNQPFYDALSRRDLPAFFNQLGVFGLIAGVLLVLNVAQRWLNEMTKLRLRQGLVHDLVKEWMVPRRAFRLANAGPIGVNPDQRLHEDARHLTELSTDLGVGLLQASILLLTFIGVLWELSSGFAFHIGGRDLTIPGYMVWAAIVYAGSASLLSYWIGRRLIDQNSDRYAREADLRFSLMRVNEHIDAVSLAGGEADEARRIGVDLDAVLAATRRLVSGLTRLTWVTAGYGWFSLVAPILVAAPVYFAGNLSFGGLMVAVGAFNQVQSSLRWFVDNFSTIADWRATLLRVASFRRAVMTTDVLHTVESRIEAVDGPPGAFTVEDLEIASPAGCTMLKEPKVEVKAGERVLIVGESGTGKTLLFRALAGLWPWGAGRIGRPTGGEIHYMPRTPYLPPGTLREVMAYPLKVDSFKPDAFTAALARLGLERLTPMLETAKRWDRDLSEDDQQSLAFARVVLHRPAWLLIDEVLDSLEDETHGRVLDVFAGDLAHAGVIHIGRAEAHDHLFQRVLHLVKEPDKRRLSRRRHAHETHRRRLSVA